MNHIKDFARTTLDVIDNIIKPRNPLIPPRNIAKRFMPASHIDYRDDYIKTGLMFRDLFLDAGLKPDDKVLEIGSGCGRMAIPLLDYLITGTYDGIDINKIGIQWCRDNITSRNSRFSFSHINIYNAHYNPEGHLLTSEFELPFKENTFDFIFLTSVFTHMLPGDIRLYLNEIARILAPDGICFMTFFLITNELHKSQTFTFQYHHEGFYSEYDDILERAVAYEESVAHQMMRDSGLTIERTIHGSWTGHSTKSFQDIVIASRG